MVSNMACAVHVTTAVEVREVAIGRLWKLSLCGRSLSEPGCMHLVTQDEAEVDRAVTEANVFALASHQYWGTWALLQVRYLQTINQPHAWRSTCDPVWPWSQLQCIP